MNSAFVWYDNNNNNNDNNNNNNNNDNDNDDNDDDDDNNNNNNNNNNNLNNTHRHTNSHGSATSLTFFCYFSVSRQGSESHRCLGKIFPKWNKLSCWIKMEYLWEMLEPLSDKLIKTRTTKW